MNREQKTVNSEDYSQQPILIVPACEKGRGGGHLVRCIALANGLKTLGREAFLFIPEIAGINCLVDDIFIDKTVLLDKTGLQGKNWEFVILDRYQTQPEELAQWAKLAPVIGIDEGGSCRNSFDFLIDLLPNCSPVKPNIADPSLLPLPSKKIQLLPHPEPAPFRILISFGLEDAAGLGSAAAQVLAVKNNGNAEITLPRSLIPNLSEHLAEFDLVITHFGLTAFEALYAGVPVLLVSPGKYHEKLAKKAGFLSLGIGKEKAGKLKKKLFEKDGINFSFLKGLQKRCSLLAEKYGLDQKPEQNLADLVNSFLPEHSPNCRVCGKKLQELPMTSLENLSQRRRDTEENLIFNSLSPASLRLCVMNNTYRCGSLALARFSDRTYISCKNCKIINMNVFAASPIEYSKDYFFEQYQKQYGKTYLEDFPNLIAMAKRRLAVIKGISSKPQTLLDIGCAYGPFLKAAKEEGFSPLGIDPCEDAVRYVNQTLGLPAIQGNFPHNYPEGEFSVITLWYVIEHFQDCTQVLAEIKKLLKPHGILAFSTPSFSGISGRTSLRRFLEKSPADHFTIWSPASCKKALKAAGFKVKKIISTGHHPERFPLLGRFAKSKKSPVYWILLAVSKIFSLGDTMEVYAVST